MGSVTEIQSGKVGFLLRRVVKVSDLKKAGVENKTDNRHQRCMT